MRRTQIVDRIRNVVHTSLPQAEVILYGSEARGDARPESDVDLLVLLPQDELTLSMRRQVSDLFYPVELDTNTAISTIVDLKDRWEQRSMTPFKYNVMNEGIRL